MKITPWERELLLSRLDAQRRQGPMQFGGFRVDGSRSRMRKLRDMERRGLIWLDAKAIDHDGRVAWIVGEVTSAAARALIAEA